MRIRDGDWALVDYDFQTGRSIWGYYDGEKTVYRIDHPVAETIKANAEARNASLNQRWGEGQRVASIPPSVFHDQLGEAARQGDDKYISRWLNDPDNRAFRTFEGKV